MKIMKIHDDPWMGLSFLSFLCVTEGWGILHDGELQGDKSGNIPLQATMNIHNARKNDVHLGYYFVIHNIECYRIAFNIGRVFLLSSKWADSV